MLHRNIGYGFLAGTVSAFISSVALASILSPSSFTVTPSAIPGVSGTFAPFTATFKQFGYTAVVTQDATGAFTEMGALNFSNFATPDTLGVIPGATSGLGATGGYSLYETFTASGVAAPDAGGNIHATFTNFTVSLFGHAGPGFTLTLNAAGIPVVPPGSVTLGSSTGFVAGEARIFASQASGDFDILGTFKPTTSFLSGSVFADTSGALYDLNGVTTLICGGITLPCGPEASGLPPFGTAFSATLIGSGNQSNGPVPQIPEPASVVLLGSGFAWIMLIMLWRRKQTA